MPTKPAARPPEPTPDSTEPKPRRRRRRTRIADALFEKGLGPAFDLGPLTPGDVLVCMLDVMSEDARSAVFRSIAARLAAPEKPRLAPPDQPEAPLAPAVPAPPRPPLPPPVGWGGNAARRRRNSSSRHPSLLLNSTFKFIVASA